MAIGVAAIVTLRSIIQSMRTGLMREARATIAADVLVQSTAWTPGDPRRPRAAARGRRSTHAPSRSRPRRWCGPSTGAPVARMVELRGVEAGYPFYGTLVLQNGAAVFARASRGCRHAGPAGAAGAARREAWRPHPHRRPAVHDPRRDRPGARPPSRRFSLGSRVLVDLADLRRPGL